MFSVCDRATAPQENGTGLNSYVGDRKEQLDQAQDDSDLASQLKRLKFLLATLADHVATVTHEPLPAALEQFHTGALSPDAPVPSGSLRDASLVNSQDQEATPVQSKDQISQAEAQRQDDHSPEETGVTEDKECISETIVIEDPSPETRTGRNTLLMPGDNVTRDNLDHGDMVVIEGSVWNTCLFIGTESIGWFVSAALALVMLIAPALQSMFVYLVYTYMLDEDPVAADRLDALLKFRVRIGHTVLEADRSTGESLITRLCRGDWSLHTAGSQFILHDNLDKFREGGRSLALVAIICWLLAILKEIMGVVHFGRAVWAVPPGPTNFHIDDGDTNHQKHVLTSEDLIKLKVVTTLQSMAFPHKMCIALFVLLPRLVIAVSLGYVGTKFLAITADMTELILNAVALVFVLDIDEAVYECFVPRRAHALLANLQPLYMPPAATEKWTAPGLHCMLKLIAIGALMVVISKEMLDPFFGRIDQAMDILCSGNLDFTEFINTNTGIIQATPSAPVTDFVWKETNLARLEMTHVNINAQFGWNPSEDVLAASRRGDSHGGMVLPAGAKLTDGTFDRASFREIVDLPVASSEDLARRDICNDEVNAGSKEEFLRKMRSLSKNSSATGCENVRHLCKKQKNNNARQLCPQTCGCAEPWSTEHISGVFATPVYGCPAMCTDLLRTFDREFYHYWSLSGYPCKDTPADRWLFNGSGQLFTHAFQIYLETLFELISSTPNIRFAMKSVLEFRGEGLLPGFNKSASNLDDIVESVLDGRNLADLLAGVWTPGRGLPTLPGNPTPCRFLTSVQVKSIWGIDLCQQSSSFLDIRSLCPESCGCLSDLASAACPMTCDATKGPVLYGSPWTCVGSECPPTDDD